VEDKVANSGVSRAQVRAEAAEATRLGRTARGEIVSVNAGA
jgi:hypothetical protein